MTKSMEKIEFGDFQTPISLAKKVVNLLQKRHHINVDIIIEPSCGVGAFVVASCQIFNKSTIYGFDINAKYINEAKKKTNLCSNEVNFKNLDFFSFDWDSFLSCFELSEQLLIIGNPPWVTSSELGSLGSKNLPKKENFEKEKGIDAITGSSNFDISEWMILQYIKWLDNRKGTIAQLCKYSVARKILKRLEKDKNICSAHIYPIDAQKEFGASVEACLFILDFNTNTKEFFVYSSIDSLKPIYTIGKRNGLIVRDLKKYDEHCELALTQEYQEQRYVWRSGLKHDCSKIMELEKLDTNKYINGYKQIIEMEDTYIYPLLKSSDIANNRLDKIRKYVIVTQRKIGDDTNIISKEAPMTWNYLLSNEHYFNRRKSSIYKNKPRFSIFGIGEYTFKPWKIAISSLYKRLNFVLISPIDNKTVIFDDTVNFLSFESKEEAEFIYHLVTSKIALDFLDSMIFWDEKRPITTKILRKLNLAAVAKKLNMFSKYQQFQGLDRTLF